MEFSSLPEECNPACVLDAFVVGKAGAHDEFSRAVHSALPDNGEVLVAGLNQALEFVFMVYIITL